MKNLLTRTLTGAVFVTLILLAVLIHPLGLKLLTLLMNLIALIEFNRIGQKLNIRIAPSTAIINTVLTAVGLTLMHFDWFKQFGILLLLLYVIIILTMALYQREGNPIISASFTLLGMFWITVPLIVLNLIHELSASEAVPFTLAIFIFIWTNDTFAYLSGIAFGRHRLFEKISPKKSWEGFFGGLIITIVLAILINHFYPWTGIMYWLIFAFLTAMASVFGDFNESLLKRTANIKDSGNIMPGHGGMLDRIDSLLLACPVIYIYLLIVLNLN